MNNLRRRFSKTRGANIENCLKFTAVAANSTIQLTKVGNTGTINVQYSTNEGKNWEKLIVDSTTITLANIGDSVVLRGKNTQFGYSSSIYHKFSMTGEISASGDITSLLNNVGEDTPTLAKYCFYSIFRDCTSLTTAPNFPSTHLDNYCYNCAFYGCSNLVTPPPILPATYLPLASYLQMFYGCSSLTSSPYISATSLSERCCESMFSNCTSLITAPSELKATTLQKDCYRYMFSGCTALTTAPSELPATSSQQRCYQQMFYGCSSLTTAPVIKATSIISSYCFASMFKGCTNLNYIKCLATTFGDASSYCLSEWVDGVAESGTFVKSSSANWPSGKSGIPSGWTVERV